MDQKTTVWETLYWVQKHFTVKLNLIYSSGEVKDRHITVINTLLLQLNLSDYQITQRVRDCVSLSAPGPYVIILVLQYNDFTESDIQKVKYVLNLFSKQAIKHTIVLTNDEETEYSSVKENDFIHQLTKDCGGGHVQFDKRNSGWLSELFRRIEKILKKEYKEFLICDVYEDEGETSVDEDPSRSGGSVKKDDKEKKDSDLNESTKTASDGGVTTGKAKLNIVLCGNDSVLKNSVSKIFRGVRNKQMNKLLPQKERSNVCVKREGTIHGQQISVIELPALFNTQLSEEEEIRQTHRCVSLCHPGVHVFILIIPDAPLNNEDRAEMEKIQRIFSSRINKHIMILIKQNSEHQTAELNEETQSVIESFGGRHQFIGSKTQVSVLMEKLEQMVEENSGVCFSTETLMETQMEKLKELEELKRKIHLLQTQESRKREDDLRIVLLGKTGAGKSSTGNTILGREAFISDISQTSVTKECQKETAEINGRHITVIDTPGLFDTELNNEEIQREMSNCISMILPGPHVFLLLIPVGRFTQEEAKSVKIIQETFGENSLIYTIVLFTRGDFLKNKTIEEFLGKTGSPLNQLIETCGNRFHVFNNKETRDRTQVTDLLQKIDNMVKANGGSYYSCKMFREIERQKQEKQMKILMEKVEQLNREKEELMNKHEEEKKKMEMKMEEERQNHEKERKRREEEFRKSEKQYKREIKEIETQERKIREELKREREKWEKQKQQERQRRDEEEERRRKKEQEMWDEYDQQLKQEKERSQREKVDLQAKHEEEKERMEREKEVLQLKHGEEMKRMKMMMDEERQIHDKERKRREEEFREREEQYEAGIKRTRGMGETEKRSKKKRRRRRGEMEKERTDNVG